MTLKYSHGNRSFGKQALAAFGRFDFSGKINYLVK
jgi:hypothetical protein